MRLFQAALDTCLGSPLLARLSVHCLHFHGLCDFEYFFEGTVSEKRTHNEFGCKLGEFCERLGGSHWHTHTHIIGREELAELSPRNSVMAKKHSLRSVFETVLSETVFGPSPIFEEIFTTTMGILGITSLKDKGAGKSPANSSMS